jgi:hypothetical protein
MMTVKINPVKKATMTSSERVVESVWSWVQKGRRRSPEPKTLSRALEVKVKEARPAPTWVDLMVEVKEQHRQRSCAQVIAKGI